MGLGGWVRGEGDGRSEETVGDGEGVRSDGPEVQKDLTAPLSGGGGGEDLVV